MSKSPMVGLVKSRLASSVGFVEATRIYKEILARTLRLFVNDPRLDSRLDSRLCLWLAITPDDDFLMHRIYSFFCGAPIRMIDQGRGNLGDRMERIFRSLPRGRIIIIGGDIPAIRRDHIFSAFSLLGSKDIVVGPSCDGGFWLIGYSGRFSFRNFFSGVRWSSPYTLNDTLAHFKDKRIGFLAPLRDVDTYEDYMRYFS